MHRLAQTQPATFGRRHFKTRTFKKYRLPVGPGRLLEPTPFFDGNQNRSLNTPPSDDLRAFFQALIQKFAKAGFRILDLPRHDGPPRVNDMTSHLTSQLKRGGSNQKSRGETRKQRRSV